MSVGDRQAVIAPETKADASPRPPAERNLIGEHITVVKLRALVDRVAATDATVLITGESGTGKEVVARTIHTLSARHGRAFVPVNCAAIPHELLESEMFGHERGAFTGASGPRHGLFSTADGGTIFLDEIGEMPLQLQAKLLRVLEDGIVGPVGSDRASKIDARVIAASNSDLVAGVKKGSFREDLFYRLQVVPIAIAPLRERRSDIPLLVEYFLSRLQARFAGRHWTVSQAAMVSLWSYDWPGNVRELEEHDRAAGDHVRGRGDRRRSAAAWHGRHHAGFRKSCSHDAGRGRRQPQCDRARTEGRMINEALRQTGGNKQAAARLLGLKRTTFSAKLRRCGVIAPAGSGWNDES